MQDKKDTIIINDRAPGLMLMRVLQGALIGGGAILPGVSGGVLAVVFGIYRPMMAFLSHPFRELKKNLWLFIPVIIGVAVGFWGFAKLMALLFAEDSPYPISLFMGLILGTVPMLIKSAGSQGRKRSDWHALGLTFALLLAFLIIIESVSSLDMPLTPIWSLVSGIIWGFSLVVPGLSSSSILLFMGLYTKIMAAVGNLDFSVIIPLISGIALVAVLCAKLVNLLFERHFSLASHAIVGLVLASTLMSVTQGLVCLLLAVLGFAAAWYMGIWGEKIKPKD
jgi:putative membrane protein